MVICLRSGGDEHGAGERRADNVFCVGKSCDRLVVEITT